VSNETQPGGASAPPIPRPTWRLPAVAAAVLLVVVLGMYLWQRSAVGDAERRLEGEKAQVVAEKAAVVKQATEVVAQKRKDALSLFAMPLAWAVRREVNAGNLDQVDQYFTEVVKQPGFTRAVFASADGIVKVSSDRKVLGQRFDELYPAELLSLEETRLVEVTPGTLVVVVPIMGLSQRQGVIAIDSTQGPLPFAP